MKNDPLFPQKHILLCGFMGAGKSTVGKLLGQRLSLRFVDTDTYIAKKHRESIPEIFASLGERKFREYEHEALRELLALPPSVIAAGGGILTYARNLELLPLTLTICLMPDFHTILKRIEGDESRPLLLYKRPEEIEALYEDRKPAYLQHAQFTVKNTSAPDQCAEEILVFLRRREDTRESGKHD